MSEKLKNNSDLYQFLCSLRAELDAKGLKEASDKVDWASHFYCGSPTEFLGESRIALLAIRNCVENHLSDDQLSAIDSVVAQINAAFDAIGGG